MKILGPIAVLLGGIYLWSNGYQNAWIIAMITIGTISACHLD